MVPPGRRGQRWPPRNQRPRRGFASSAPRGAGIRAAQPHGEQGRVERESGRLATRPGLNDELAAIAYSAAFRRVDPANPSPPVAAG